MLASINPLGERSRNSIFGVTVVAYVVGSLVGGALAGGLMGVAGAGASALVPWGPIATAVAVVLVCVIGVALDLGAVGLRLPSIRRQVNEYWLDEYRGWVYGLAFGFQLGLGVVTIVTTATVYVWLALAFLTTSLPAGLLIGAVFGAVRAVPMLTVARVYDPGELRRRLSRSQTWAPVAQRIATAALVVVAAVGIVTAAS